jgi:uncharacterized protein (TIGR00369 family)
MRAMETGEDGALGALMTGGTGLAPDGIGEGEVIAGLPFSGEIGMRLHGAADGVAVLSVPYDARLVGDPETGVLHGGVVTALLDTACGSAVMAVPEPLATTATLDLRIDYMRPARAGMRVVARAECHRLTRSMAFVRAVAFHEAGEGTAEEVIASAAAAFVIERAGEGATP